MYKSYFGFRIAEKANEKNWRAVHRFEEHKSFIYDISYYIIFDIN